ncbi:hypothetical protein ACBY01_00470 [Sphingomonas sp. ac-8]|uniref:hypothetical protein n=1 Tax=Sphingomonas sp. ac-8 TaxID=3242977 RepID=UPI003A811691
MTASLAKPLAGRTRVRIDLTARVLTASLGNYAVTSLFTALVARLWPTGPAEASMAATLLSFVLFPVLAMTAFAVRSPWRLWLWLAGCGAVLGGGLWLSLASGGRL